MIYTSVSLNGAWEMQYSDNIYTGDKNPWKSGCMIENAVPGYWEDMAEMFAAAPFFSRLKINPEYGLQRYPIAHTAPDMALPNIVGNFFYNRNFTCDLPEGDAVIHFGGVQNSVSVWINDVFLGRHEGYSAPFGMNIPAGTLLKGENNIVMSVSNQWLRGYDDEPVLGLTTRAANNYTGGLTGDVEIRIFNCPLRDAAVLIDEDCKNAYVQIDMAEQAEVEWRVYDGDLLVKSGEARENFSFDTDGMELWSPENPRLYTLELISMGRSLIRKFGIRRLIADGAHLKLNGIPYYLRGICEHCYFPETVHPAHDEQYYRRIIKTIKKLGFNFIRFHTYIPEEEYMKAADELGVLLHVECPNNTTAAQWAEIVTFCRRHTSVVIYCGGNELLMDEPYIDYLSRYARDVHLRTDALFSPQSAMRGLEYAWALEPEIEQETSDYPFKHHPERFELAGKFSDMYSSFTCSLNSYDSLDADPAKVDSWSVVYNKPRVCHEICIDGTFADLSLKERYKGLRIGKTEMFSSVEAHLENQGVLKKVPLYFKNSSQWQRRVRKYCFEATRMSRNLAGYDFLGPIDTHWHTFGYDVGMMNEFYELKPGETLRNVRMYNSPTVLLTDLFKKRNFYSGEDFKTGIFVSHYGMSDLTNASLCIRLMMDNKIICRENVQVANIKNGSVEKLRDFACRLPELSLPAALRLYVTLEGGDILAENEWELYVFPKKEIICSDVVVANDAAPEELVDNLKKGKRVLLLNSGIFAGMPTTFRIALAGRTSGNLATVIYDHPALKDMPHDGFCGWQFEKLFEGGRAVCFKDTSVPFNPIIEVVSTHKNFVRQAALFEYRVYDGILLVCGFRFDDDDPASQWLKWSLSRYISGKELSPCDSLTEEQLQALFEIQCTHIDTNSNVALNLNDKTALRKSKK